jgi:hypothetical protein
MIYARVSAVVTLVTIAAQGALARADETGSAAALFESGLQAMQASRFAEACPKLAESYWLDPRPGVLFTLAECEAQWEKLASALAHYDDYLRLYGSMPAGLQAVQHDRAEIARRQRALLAERVPTLTLILPASAPPGMVVRRDDVALGAPSLGIPLPVDPGTHVIVTQLPDGRRVSREILVRAGDGLRVDLELPAAAPAAAPPPEANVAPAARSSVPTLPVTLLSVGAAGLVVGGATGGMALAGKSTIDAHCTGTLCDVDGKHVADQAKAYGWASTAAFGAGGAAVAAGAILWLVSPRRSGPERSALAPASWNAGGATCAGLRGKF